MPSFGCFKSIFKTSSLFGVFNNFKSTIRPFSDAAPKSGLEQFFENGLAYPIYDQEKKTIFGRAWKAAELRNKSFEDLHQLWYILLKERNLLATQEAESRRLGQMFFGKHRELKCKLSMTRIKTILTERQHTHNQSMQLIKQKDAGSQSAEGDLILEQNQKTIYKRAEIKRKVRKSLNYIKKRQPLFT